MAVRRAHVELCGLCEEAPRMLVLLDEVVVAARREPTHRSVGVGIDELVRNVEYLKSHARHPNFQNHFDFSLLSTPHLLGVSESPRCAMHCLEKPLSECTPWGAAHGALVPELHESRDVYG